MIFIAAADSFTRRIVHFDVLLMLLFKALMCCDAVGDYSNSLLRYIFAMGFFTFYTFVQDKLYDPSGAIHGENMNGRNLIATFAIDMQFVITRNL